MVPKRSYDSIGTDSSGSPGVRSTKAPRISGRGKPVTVVVGRGHNAADFFFPADLLTQNSEFAKGALRGGCVESRTGNIPLREEVPEVFQTFSTFTYTGKINSYKEGDTNEGRPDFDAEWPRLRDAWILGDKLLSQTFKDAICDAVIEKVIASQKYPIQLYWTAYGKSIQETGLRRVAIDLAVFYWRDEVFHEEYNAHAASTEFFRDVCLRCKARTPGEALPWIDCGCKYHDHGTGKPCYKTMF